MGDRVTKLQQEMQTILEEKFIQLREQVQKMELLTREIIKTELSTEQTNEKHKSLQQELDLLQQGVKKQQDLLSITQQKFASTQQTSRDITTKNQQLTEQIKAHTNNNQGYQEELESLEQQNKTLEEDNAKLKLQIDFLKENIAKLRQLKDENMLSVMNLTNSLQDVSSGKD
jgi:chromosome segregation ATPase